MNKFVILNNKLRKDVRRKYKRIALFVFLSSTSIGLLSCARIDQPSTIEQKLQPDSNDRAPLAPDAQTPPRKQAAGEEQETRKGPTKTLPQLVDKTPEISREIKPGKIQDKIIPEKIAEPTTPEVIAAPLPPTTKPEPTKELTKIAIPSSRTIERPIIRKSKLKKEFTSEEGKLDKYWSAKASELAKILQDSSQVKMRTKLAQEMQKLSDAEFTFLTTQPYFWSIILSGHLYIFSAILSSEKLSIAADVIINDDLIKLNQNIPKTLQNLIMQIVTGDSDELAKLAREDQEKFQQETFAKLKAFLKAATIDGQIGDAINNKASAYSRATKDKKGYEEILAKLKEAKMMRAQYIADKEEKQKAMPIVTAKPKKPSKWNKIIKAPAVERAEKISIDIAAIKKDLFDWLNKKDYALDPNDIMLYKKYLLAILKLFPTADNVTQELMKKAFQETVAQHSPLNDFLNVLKSITDQNEHKLFMQLFPAQYILKGKSVDTMKSLWDKELNSFAGASVREEQSERLIAMLGALDEQQLENSFKVSNFWVLLENQPEAAAVGLSPEAYKNIVIYLLKHDQARITSFANKVISKIKIDDIKPETMIEIFRALIPLSKADGEMEKTLVIKKNAFLIKYKKHPQIDDWKKLLDQPL